MFLKAQIEKLKVERSYDVFFAICGFSLDLSILERAKPFMDACAVKICLIDELWVKEMRSRRYFLDVLKRLDFVFMYYRQSVQPLSEQVGVRCSFLPPGIDSVLFYPPPASPPPRVVDVYSIGRRSQRTHEALLRMAERQSMFYLHDSLAGNQAINAQEHRLLYANVAKRSKYFIVNPGLIDRPDVRGSQLEIGNRYFEGAAAGTIMIGEKPDTREFEELFGWPDALIHLPYDSDTVADIISDFERQPDRQEAARRTNIFNALTRHDWAYRWESILTFAGVERTAALAEKKEQLHQLSQEFR